MIAIAMLVVMRGLMMVRIVNKRGGMLTLSFVRQLLRDEG